MPAIINRNAESLGRHAPQQLKHDNIVNLIEVFRRKSKLQGQLPRPLLPSCTSRRRRSR